MDNGLYPTGLRRIDKSRPVVTLQLTGVLPPSPPTADHLAGITAWNGDTNLKFGTCGPCAVANSAILTWHDLLGTDISCSDTAIYDLYRRSGNPSFDPSTGAGDNGVDPTVMLAEVVRNGIDLTFGSTVTRTRPLCFAQVSFPPYEALHAATAIFGGCLLALSLDVAQQGQLSQGLWSYVPSSQAWGGHATLGGAYTGAATAQTLDESLITWQQRCGTTVGFMSHQCDAVYVIVWEPIWNNPAFVAGVNQAQLAADYTALTGQPFPQPVPPAPPPPAPPSPGDPDAKFYYGPGSLPTGLRGWLNGARSRQDLVELKQDGQAWARAKGYPVP